MSVNIIDTLKPKNGGNFPIVEAIDVFVEDYENLADAISHFATDTMIAAINAVLSSKANTTDVNTAVANLQEQINQIEISASAEAVVAPEVAGARVGADSTSYTTLKERLDAEYDSLNSDYISSQTKSAFQALVVSHEMYSTTGRASSTSTIVDSYRTEIVPCSEGEEFEYFGRCDVNYAAVVWFNGDSLISYDQTTEVRAAKYTFTAPANATKCAFSSYSTDKFYVISKSRNVSGNVDHSINEIRSNIQVNENEIQTVNDFVHSALYNTVNLFNKNSEDILEECYISTTSVVTDYYENARISHWIAVRNGITYKFNADSYFGVNTGSLLFAEQMNMQNAQHISGEVTDSESSKYVTFTAPNDGYIRFNQSLSMANIQMFCDSSEYPNEYVAYGIILDSSVDMPDPNAADIQGLITKNQVDFISHEESANLFNKNDAVDGYYLMPTDGRTVENANNFYVYVPIFTGRFTLMVNTLIFGQYNGLQLPLYNESFEKVGVISGTSPTSVNVEKQEAHFELTQSKIDQLGAKYIGYSSAISLKDSLMIVKGDTYPSEYIPYVNRYVLVGVEPEEQIRDDYIKNSLSSKIVVFDGDSICQAISEGTSGRNGWPYRIGTNNHMDWANVGVNGGTITAELYASGGVARHWLSRYIDTIHSNYEELDYLILEGGTNDADLLGENGIGVFDVNDYSGIYDDTNFTGALDSLFYKAINYYPTAKIGFIIAQKMGVSNDYTTTSNIRRIYFERAMDVCKKWGIPYINLWDNSALNPKLPCFFDSSLDAQGNRDGGYAYTDGQHLTGKGYDIVSPKIEAWMRTL